MTDFQIAGLPQGMGVFHVDVTVSTTTVEDNWAGSRQYPTFWTVGANEFDAIANARAILGLRPGAVHLRPHGGRPETIDYLHIRVQNAEPVDGNLPAVTWDSRDNNPLTGAHPVYEVSDSAGRRGRIWQDGGTHPNRWHADSYQHANLLTGHRLTRPDPSYCLGELMYRFIHEPV